MVLDIRSSFSTLISSWENVAKASVVVGASFISSVIIVRLANQYFEDLYDMQQPPEVIENNITKLKIVTAVAVIVGAVVPIKLPIHFTKIDLKGTLVLFAIDCLFYKIISDRFPRLKIQGFRMVCLGRAPFSTACGLLGHRYFSILSTTAFGLAFASTLIIYINALNPTVFEGNPLPRRIYNNLSNALRWALAPIEQ